MDTSLQKIADKINHHQRLDAHDGLALLHSNDLHTIGHLAHIVRQRLHSNITYYNINRHLNYTNLCALSCQFCSFYRKPNDPRGGIYEYSLSQIAQQAQQASLAGATEIHIVGGLHPYLPFSYYTDMLQTIRSTAPQLHIKAFTAVEIVHLARISKRPNQLAQVLKDLQQAGLGSLPGGGAEVFDDRVHDQAFKGKIRSDLWLQVHHTAHQLGLMTNATILHGHIESPTDRIQHLLMLRDAQDQALSQNLPAHFQTVIPLPFFPDDSQLQHLPGPSAIDNIKMIAVARLLLDNIPHIKAFWIMQSLPLAQLALLYGADDIDGTVIWYDITKLASPSTHQEVGVTQLRQTIRDAGFIPIERDTLYRPVSRQGPRWHTPSHTSPTHSSASSSASTLSN